MMASPPGRGELTGQSVGIALAVPPLLAVPLLFDGGLAPILVTTAFALVVGAPAAIAEWRTRASAASLHSGREAGLTAIAELAGLLLVATALAELTRIGPLGWGLALVAWPAGAALSRLPRALAAPAVIGLVGLCAAAAVTAVSAPPWTLLEAHWETWPQYLGPAATAGVLLGGAGTGHWTLGPRRPPGDRHSAWVVVGIGLLMTVVLVVEAGARFEASLGSIGAGLAASLLTGVALVSTTASLALRTGLSPIARMAAGLALTLVASGPASGIRPWVGLVVVPALAATLLAATAARATGGDRLAAGAAAGVLAIGAAVAWPGVPDQTLDAVWIGLLVVGAFWFVATRSLLAGRTA